MYIVKPLPESEGFTIYPISDLQMNDVSSFTLRQMELSRFTGFVASQ